MSHYYFEMKAVKLDGWKVPDFIRSIWKRFKTVQSCTWTLKLKNSATLLTLTSTLDNVTSLLEFLNGCIWQFWIGVIFELKSQLFFKSRWSWTLEKLFVWCIFCLNYWSVWIFCSVILTQKMLGEGIKKRPMGAIPAQDTAFM